MSSNPIKPLDIKWSDSSFSHLKKDFSKSNLLAVGEIHGVAENLSFYLDLIAKLGIEQLALELQPAYSKSNLRVPMQDGRFSKEHELFINQLEKNNKIKSFIFFDESKQDMNWNERDKAYVGSFISQYDESLPTLLVAGNLHTRLSPFHHKEMKDTLYPMLYHLRQQLGKFPAIRLRYSQGAFYNFGVNKFDSKKEWDNNEVIYQKPYSYEGRIAKAHPVTI